MRIVIIEDDTLLREHLRLLLGGEAGIEVVGAFGCAEDALPTLEEIAPHVMLVDIGLPGMSGIEFIRRAKSMFPDAEIMAFTVFEDKDTVFSALKAGATGYILKGATPRELVEALHGLYEGGSPMSPKIARAIIMDFQERGDEQYVLSPREKEILSAVEKGLSYKEIADKLNVSPHTVHTHIKNIYEKLHAKSRSEAILKAKRKGII